MIDLQLLAILVTSITALIGAIIALSRRRPDAAKVLVGSAQNVVIMQDKALERTNKRLDELETEVKALRKEVKELEKARDQYANQLQRAQVRVRTLSRRVDQLEALLLHHDIAIPPEWEQFPPDDNEGDE